MIGNIQAFWGPHVLLTSEKHIRPIMEGLNLVSELDVDQEGATEAQNPLNVRGGDKQKSFQIATQSSIESGTLDPVTEYNQFVRDLGKSLPFIVGYLPFGALRMILERVRMEDVIFVYPGKISTAMLILDFVEDMPATAVAKEVKDESGISKAEKTAKAKEINFKFNPGELAEEKRIIGVS